MNKKVKISLFIVVLLGIFHFGVEFTAHKFLNEFKDRKISFSYQDLEESPKDLIKSLDKNLTPFSSEKLLDQDGLNWTTSFSHGMAGVTIFDANGDGRLDLYFPNDGNNRIHATDKKGVLLDHPRRQHNMLYINMGNDSKNRPIFKSSDKLALKNSKFQKEELLTQNLLFPSDKNSIGRKSIAAMAVDINGDGRQDLIVANGLPGTFFSHPKTQEIPPVQIDPTNRKVKNRRTKLESEILFFFKNYKPTHELNVQRKTSEGMEYYGQNTIFINRGDKDKDGLPEWENITLKSHFGGKRNTTGFTVADFDLDGDLDIFETNIVDPDYWPLGSQYYAGAKNQYWKNLLSETGSLTFKNASDEMGVTGEVTEKNPKNPFYRLRKIPFLPLSYSMALLKVESYMAKWLEIDEFKSEKARLTWGSLVQDVNDDGYPDLWVANDFDKLELYYNFGGKKLEYTPTYKSYSFGSWMGFAPADFNGDLKEDLFVGNIGGVFPLFVEDEVSAYDLFNPTLKLTMFFKQNYPYNAFISGGAVPKDLNTKITYSKILPPASDPELIKEKSPKALEFTWGSAAFDADNDGKMDLYTHGAVWGRAGAHFSFAATSPGRFLHNTTKTTNEASFEDRTAESHLFNINHLDYSPLFSEGQLVRPAPSTNWNKRSIIKSSDRSSFNIRSSSGESIREKNIHDLTLTSESGRAAISADLNGDGLEDLILRNVGGFDSRSPHNSNLKIKIDGVAKAVPSHNYNLPAFTNFEPGDTKIHLNHNKGNNWIKVNLIDEDSYNRDAIGAKVIINGKYLKIKRASPGSAVSYYNGPLHFGLGQDSAHELTITWPDKKRTQTVVSLKNAKNKTLVVSKLRGLL